MRMTPAREWWKRSGVFKYSCVPLPRYTFDPEWASGIFRVQSGCILLFDMSVMDGVRIPIERMCALNKWKMVGEVLVPGVLNAGDINKTDGCKKAAALVDVI